MRLSAAIMAHPARADLVAEMQATLDRDVPIVWDTDTGPPSADKQRRWRTGRRAWETHHPDADWHIVLQDDALTSPDLIAGLEKALDHIPDSVNLVCPYFGTKRPSQLVVTRLAREARNDDASFIRSTSLNWGVAIIARTATIDTMLHWCDERKSLPYDTRVGRYYRDHLHQECWYTWPSLVDHRDGPSLISHSDNGRHAHLFHQSSALELAWDGPVLADPRVRRNELLAQRRAASTTRTGPPEPANPPRQARLKPRPIALNR